MTVKFPPLRVRIFISSTASELRAERDAVIKTIERDERLRPVFFEGWGSKPEAPRDVCLNNVRESDVYIGIFWNQYSLPTKEEYDGARKAGKPCLIYIKDIDTHKRDPELTDFIRNLEDYETGHFRSIFRTPQDLAARVSKDIEEWIAKRIVNVLRRLERLIKECKGESSGCSDAMDLLEVGIQRVISGNERLRTWIEHHKRFRRLEKSLEPCYVIAISLSEKPKEPINIRNIRLQWEYATKGLLDEIELDTKDIEEPSDWVRSLREIEQRINEVVQSARYDRLQGTEFDKLAKSLSEFHGRVAECVANTARRIEDTADELQGLLW